jgi:hypothetical protein
MSYFDSLFSGDINGLTSKYRQPYAPPDGTTTDPGSGIGGQPGMNTAGTGPDPTIPQSPWKPFEMPVGPAPVAIGKATDNGFNYRPSPYTGDIMGALAKIYTTGGGFNDAAVQRRISNADDSLRRFQKSQASTDAAALAARGIGPGEGPSQTAYGRLAENVAGQYSGAVNDIYANESQLADQRLMSALQQAAGLSASEAQNYVDQFKSDTERQLGFNQLDLGHETNAITQNRDLRNFSLGQGALVNQDHANTNDYNLGADRNQISRDQISQNDRFHNDDTLTQILNILNGTAGKTSEGHV